MRFETCKFFLTKDLEVKFLLRKDLHRFPALGWGGSPTRFISPIKFRISFCGGELRQRGGMRKGMSLLGICDFGWAGGLDMAFLLGFLGVFGTTLFCLYVLFWEERAWVGLS
jgi:hypothetical protein